MYLVLSKQKSNISKSSAGFVIKFFSSVKFRVSLVQPGNCFSPSRLVGIFHTWLVLFILAMCIPHCLLALSFFSDSNVWMVRVHVQRIFKVRLSPSKSLTSFYLLLQWKLSKTDEKCFLFHLKSFFRSQIFKFLSWLFGYVEKTSWVER